MNRMSRCAITILFVPLVIAALPAVEGAAASRQAAGQPPHQAVDEEYTARILEYTTEKFFLTDLVDHLPASETVPSPEKILGYVIGTPEKLTYTRDIDRYMRELAKASARVRVYSIGLSDEGREVLAVMISDEANLARLGRIKEVNRLLADPRRIKDDAEAAALIAETKPIYWVSGSIHSPETGSPEMLMELAYRLAVEESPFVRNIRQDAIVMITPVSEVDGHDRQVDVYRYRKENPGKQAPNLVYWGDYVAHDNNRDGITVSLKLTQIMLSNFLAWHPLVLHDLHESVPFLYTSTGNGPYNAWLDPIVINEWQELAYYEVQEFAKRGVPGVWTQGFYDGWAPNYMFYIANGHNSIGRFYETFGGRGSADTMERSVPPSQTRREWYRPNPPLPRVKWSIRNNINLQESGVMMAISYAASNGDRLLRNFYLKGKRAIAKATNEGPAAYVIPAEEPRRYGAADLVNLLRRQGCEVHVAAETIKTKDGDFSAGSYVVRMDQPYSRMADMLLDTQYFNPSDPRPYDDTGWTLGPLKNVKTIRVKDTAILKGAMNLLSQDARPEGSITGQEGEAYAVENHADLSLALLRFRLADVKMLVAEETFKSGSHDFPRGTFLIPSGEGTRARLIDAARQLGIRVTALAGLPKVPVHETVVPRIAILHTWINTQNEGWYRLAFDTLGIPYSYISNEEVRETPDLKAKYDVIVFPPAGSSAQRVVNGMPMQGDPVPWKATDKYPNLTGPNGAQTDDIRRGMELEGVLNLKRFAEEGGLFVVVAGASALPIDYGLVEGLSVVEPPQLKARGSVLNSEITEPESPVAYGYDDQVALYFPGAPVFNVRTGAELFRSFGGFDQPSGGRETGRGGPGDPDIPQARPLFTAPTPELPEDSIPEEYREVARGLLPPEELRPRILIRWAAEKELLVSGMLGGGADLAGKPAVVLAPIGNGNILFFANNPFWRMETNGSYMLFFNAAMNYTHLAVKKAKQDSN
jgi:hypothetical protein